MKIEKRIQKQIKPIHDTLKDKFKIIDVYIYNNPESSVAKYIKNRVNEMVNANEIELWCYYYKRVSNMYLAGRNFRSSMIDYRQDFIYCTDSEKGIGRNNVRKCRNQALLELINFAKEMQHFLLMMNDGFVEVPNDYSNTNGIINITYLADYKILSNCFSNIRKSSNFFYISDDDKKILSKRRKN